MTQRASSGDAADPSVPIGPEIAKPPVATHVDTNDRPTRWQATARTFPRITTSLKTRPMRHAKVGAPIGNINGAKGTYWRAAACLQAAAGASNLQATTCNDHIQTMQAKTRNDRWQN
jgi:hypothetical protein